MATDESVTVKGSPVRSLQKFIESELTAEQRAAVVAALPPEYAKRFQTVILATETVPVAMLNRFTEEAAKVKGERLETFAQRAGRRAAEDAMNGIYRFFARVLTPTTLLGKASQMWSSLYNRGHLDVVAQGEGSATIRIGDFPTELAGCSRLTGWLERMAELTGAKNVKAVQTKCYAKGGPHCEWNVTWQ